MTKQKLQLFALPGLYAVCRLDKNAPAPAWPSSGAFISVTRTADELSVVCPQDQMPNGVRCERDWRCLRVRGTIAFNAVGVLASLVVPLAEAGISVVAISTFDTDYLLVKDQDWDRTVAELLQAGYTIHNNES